MRDFVMQEPSTSGAGFSPSFASLYKTVDPDTSDTIPFPSGFNTVAWDYQNSVMVGGAPDYSIDLNAAVPTKIRFITPGIYLARFDVKSLDNAVAAGIWSTQYTKTGDALFVNGLESNVTFSLEGNMEDFRWVDVFYPVDADATLELGLTNPTIGDVNINVDVFLYRIAPPLPTTAFTFFTEPV